VLPDTGERYLSTDLYDASDVTYWENQPVAAVGDD